MGVHKYEALQQYEALQLDYPLKDVDPLEKSSLEKAKEVFRNYGFTV